MANTNPAHVLKVRFPLLGEEWCSRKTMDLITNNDDIGAEVTQSRVNNHLKLTVRVIQVARSASGYRNPWWAHVAPMEGKSAISDEPIEYVLCIRQRPGDR